MPFARVGAFVRARTRNTLVRSVGVLLGGTAAAQAIGFLALPAITRLYQPSDMSVLAGYAAALGILSCVACLRYEVAIPIPRRDREAAYLLVVALCASAIAAIVTGCLVWMLWAVAGFPHTGIAGHYLWFLPAGVWLTSSYSALQFWATRKGSFRIIAKTKVAQSSAGAAAQIGLGHLSFGYAGLILGHILSSSAGLLALARAAYSTTALRRMRWRTARRVSRAFANFPKYAALEALANTSSAQFPILIISAALAGPHAGYLILAMRAIGVPMSLFGASVAQVYSSRASEAHRRGELNSLTLSVVSGLFSIGVGPLVFAAILAPIAFPTAFGKQWAPAGQLVPWMAPWLALQFVTSPVSISLDILAMQRRALALQIGGLTLRCGALAGALIWAPNIALEVFSLASAMFYAFYFNTIRHAVGIPASAFLQHSTKCFKVILGWVIAGTVLRSLLTIAGAI